MQFTKRTDNGKAAAVAISPDGRYVVYVLRDAEKQSLRVQNVATRSDVQVLAPDVVEFDGLTFSPDGNHIYFVRSDKSTAQYRYLYEMPVLGGSPRQLIRDLDAPIDFSPDSKQFVFQRGIPERNVVEVRIAPADGGGERLLATLPANTSFQYGPSWSPDGKTIAIATLGVGEAVNWGLSVINIADGRTRTLFSSGGRYVGRPVWTPDGDALVATVAETTLGRGQLQSIEYPSGKMRRITNDLADYVPTLDLTRAGSMLAAIQRTRVSDIWIAPAADTTQARQLTSGESPFSGVAPGPSGKLLTASVSGDLWLMNPDGSERSIAVSQAHNVLSISSCGDRYLLFDSYRDGKVELWRADPDGLNGIKRLDEVEYSDCSADGKWAFYDVNNKLYRMPPGDGAPVEIVTVPGNSGAYRLKVSPDGTLVAFMYREGSPVPVLKLGVVSTEGGPLRFASPVPIGSMGLGW
jgi:eukaryotic-like serine/threonine-protein kinase